MKVLVIGSGGREHALVWKIAQSKAVDKLYCAPGNPGMAEHAELVQIGSDDLSKLRNFAKENKVDLTLVGPEDPLAHGIVDEFRRSGLKVFGPTAKAAELEGSKVFCKQILHKHAVPTAAFRVFDRAGRAKEYIKSVGAPIVVKADGLAKGKGVIVCATEEEACDAVDLIMKKKEFGDAGDRVLVEQCLVGEEASVLAFTDGKTIMPMESAQDHKPIFDGDKGPNTGGMGAYSPAPVVTDKLSRIVEEKILVPTVHAMNREERPYLGVLYAGLMIDENGPQVLEFNVRFGDPETQPIVMRMKSDLVPVLMATAEGRLEEAELEWHPQAAVCVVMASGGYPGSYEKGKEITGLDEANAMEDVVVFHAGTARKDGKIVTNGGRVLGVTALGDGIAAAQARAYEAVKKIHFEGAQYRTDIGAKALNRGDA
ncbi:MAG: phosphoribosylamine--glycine ligase [Planctomycetes bacterium]|nr:phosphoribosylamine--glycine ligase [Planctomycetota bacterium]